MEERATYDVFKVGDKVVLKDGTEAIVIEDTCYCGNCLTVKDSKGEIRFERKKDVKMMREREDKHKFSVGDRVRVLKRYWLGESLEGKLGKILQINDKDKDFLIEFDENVDGHDGDGLGKNLHCLFILQKDVELLPKKQMFKIGDRVLVNKDIEDVYPTKGKYATIVGEYGGFGDWDYALEFDEEILGGHYCRGASRPRCGLWASVSEFSKPKNIISEEIVEDYTDEPFEASAYLMVSKVIFRDNKTILFYYSELTRRSGKAIASCHPDAKYSKKIGFEVALLKALQQEIPHAIHHLTSGKHER